MHPSGQKAAFAMLVGSAPAQYTPSDGRWQLFEVSGLGRNEVAVITKVAGQPSMCNN